MFMPNDSLERVRNDLYDAGKRIHQLEIEMTLCSEKLSAAEERVQSLSKHNLDVQDCLDQMEARLQSLETEIEVARGDLRRQLMNRTS
jgi:chromosome segregation ATPase